MLKRYRHVILIMLFLANVINYLDRAALSVAAPFIVEELQINSAELGLVFSSFFLGYAIFNFVGGYFSDIYGPRKVLSGSMMLWSLFVGMTGVVYNFFSLLIVRVFFGMGEGPISATTSKALYNWFPTKERASAIGISFAGGPLGAAVAGPVIGMLAIYWGWRISFVHFLSNTSGIVAPALTGCIVQLTGHFLGAFLLAGALALAGSIAVGFFVKSIDV